MTVAKAKMNSFNLPQEIIAIAETCKKHQFDVWVVGGAVRNHLLGTKIMDWDLATQATPDQILTMFTHANDASAEFGCVLIPTPIGNIQLTTLRQESQYKDRRRPHQVTFTDQIEKDLSRRDFTCNAVAYHILMRQWIDPFGGQKAIKDKIIVAVGDPIQRLEEDALRILRAVRFQSELGFQIESTLLRALQSTHPTIRFLSSERIYVEWTRIVCGDFVDIAFDTLFAMGNPKILPIEISQVSKVALLPPVFWIRMVGLLEKTPTVFDQVSSRAWIDFGIPKKQYTWIHRLLELLSHNKKMNDQSRYRWLKFYVEVQDQDALLAALKLWNQNETHQYIEDFLNQHPNFRFQDLPLSTEEIVKISGVSAGPALGKLLESLHIWVANHPQKLSRGHIENWLKERYTQRV